MLRLFLAASCALLALAAGARAQSNPRLDAAFFGADTGPTTGDGFCDDPRFTGRRMGANPVQTGRDATDCSLTYQLGMIQLAPDAPAASPAPAVAAAPAGGTPDFGEDTSQWARDGECDDLRFTGPGMAASNTNAHILKDATDCRAAWNAGTVTLRQGAIPEFAERDGGAAAPAAATMAQAEPSLPPLTPEQIAARPAAPDFGDDNNEYAFDDECDDPRFGGPAGMAAFPVMTRLAHDATDCRTAWEWGEITTVEHWADIDATGAGAQAHLYYLTQQMDPAVYDDGVSSDPFGLDMFDYGDDTSRYARDDLCNDPRFTGSMMGAVLDAEPGHDADDCEYQYENYGIDLKDGETLPQMGGGSAAGGMTQAEFARSMRDTMNAGVSYYFGDDASLLANDNFCDDTRFQGPGMGPGTVNDVNGHDATDCQAAYYAQNIMLRPGVTVPQFAMGDDSGTRPFDGLCDDPRFVGLGAAGEVEEANRFRDATDCQVAWAFGMLIPAEGPPR